MLQLDLHDSLTNGIATIDALLDALELTKTGTEKLELVTKIVTFYRDELPSGTTVGSITNAELGSAFLFIIIRFLKNILTTVGEEEGRAAAQSTIDQAIAAATGIIE